MSAVRAFTNAHRIKHERDWDTLYIFLDIHGTIMLPNWSGLSEEWYPMAIEALQEMAKDPIYKIVIWTCSKEADRLHYKELLEERGIPIYAINENPEIAGKLDWGDYSVKPYCNVLLDDKAGFDPYIEWPELMAFFKAKNKELGL